MPKYKVLQKFIDIQTKELYEADQEIEMTAARAEQAKKNLAKHDGDFLKPIEEKKEAKAKRKKG